MNNDSLKGIKALLEYLKIDAITEFVKKAIKLYMQTNEPIFFMVVYILHLNKFISLGSDNVIDIINQFPDADLGEYLKGINAVFDHQEENALNIFQRQQLNNEIKIKEYSLIRLRTDSRGIYYLMINSDIRSVAGGAFETLDLLHNGTVEEFASEEDRPDKVYSSIKRELEVLVIKYRSETPVTEAKPRKVKIPKQQFSDEFNTSDSNIWWNNDGIWKISFENKTKEFTDKTGMKYLSILLQNPFRNFSLTELDRLVNPGEIDKDSPAIKKISNEESYDELSGKGIKPRYVKLTDKKAINSCKMEIKSLEKKMDYAQQIGNCDEVDQLKEEIRQIEGYLNKSTQFGSNKPLLLIPELEKIRKRIDGNIRYCYKSIAKKHKSLASHLKSYVKIGKNCTYRPNPKTNWDVKL